VAAVRTPRVAYITNLSPYYRRPFFERLAEEVDTTFFFFGGHERYLGHGMDHDPGSVTVRELRRLRIAGHPVLPGLWNELRRGNYDVVVKDMDGRLMVPYVHWLTRARCIPLVLWSGMWHHPQTPAHSLTRPLVERVYRDAAAIVAYGNHVKGHVTEVPGVDSDKVFVAGQAIEPSPFAAVTPTFGEPAVILFVGRLEDEKGVRDLVNAFHTLRLPCARLLFAGTGSLRDAVKRYGRDDWRIKAIGHVPNSQLPRLMSSARCLVLPSLTTRKFREPWGLVVNEAMAAGLPVVATDAVGAAAGGLVVDGRNGLIVPERDPGPLADALGALIADAHLARRLGEQARRDVAAFDFDRMVRAFTDAIDHALGTRRHASPRRTTSTSVEQDGSAASGTAVLTTSWDDGVPEDVEMARLLGRYGYLGTFYATTGPGGARTVSDDGIVEIVRLGHEYGNHGRSHRLFPTLTDEELLDEIVWGEAEIRRFAEPGVMVAPPGGAVTGAVVRVLNAQGLRVRTAPILGAQKGSPGALVPTAQVYPHSSVRTCQQLIRRRAVPAAPYLKAWASSRTVRGRLGRMVEAAGSAGLVLHLWGHSREIDGLGLWRDLEDLLEEARKRGLRATTNSGLVSEYGGP
jgi:glycosyltransferase involved in cell wall biosynthesis/peptidoglycan/xylan/chitin deacetylase (PgdA/CDA1 family)